LAYNDYLAAPKISAAAKMLLKSLWKDFNKDFDEFLEIFRRHKENVDEEANLCHIVEAAEERHDQQAETRSVEMIRRVLTQVELTSTGRAKMGIYNGETAHLGLPAKTESFAQD
jgi:hypothetical protein